MRTSSAFFHIFPASFNLYWGHFSSAPWPCWGRPSKRQPPHGPHGHVQRAASHVDYPARCIQFGASRGEQKPWEHMGKRRCSMPLWISTEKLDFCVEELCRMFGRFAAGEKWISGSKCDCPGGCLQSQEGGVSGW